MYKYVFFVCALLLTKQSFAHPFPKSVVSLSILKKSIKGEAKIPLIELESAVGMQPDTSLNINTPYFRDYFLNHIKAVSNKKPWNTSIDSLSVMDNADEAIGNFQQVLVYFKLTPPDQKYLRQFKFNYDAVLHQVVTDKALVIVNEDWLNGVHNEGSAQVLGIIKTDIPTGKLFPLNVNLQQGSAWKGFTSMVNLGMQHIKEGTDHLLFLVALLLPSMLLTDGKRWKSFGGTKYSFTRLLKVVTAFTIGHSITLLLGSLGWMKVPEQPIEILIAVSILVSAIHAISPIFPGKEMYVAAGFGLIHGLAFASTLSNLSLGADTLVLSILGFNLGIEIMQLFIISIIIPWLMLLSKTSVYKWFRITGAACAGLAAIAWIIERSSGTQNVISEFIVKLYPYALWLIIVIALFALTTYALSIYHLKKRLINTGEQGSFKIY